jgi:hypothetical protein
MFLCYLIFLDIESILSEIFILILLNAFGRIIQLDLVDILLSISRKDITRRFILTYNIKYNPFKILPADQDPLYLSYAAS